ncbi:MAG: glycosyltransferase family 39 protein [Spirochaetales bacterium]|nr:glycosyltransferase family 39 protein [Spirochaetales bacterium]
MMRKIVNSITKPLKGTLITGGKYFASNWIELIFKLVYIIILVIIVQSIFAFGFKAWLYPIKLYQYYDECSYISMGKYFRLFSPFTLFKDYLLKDKPIPPVYHEFHSRAVYWSYILSLPMKQSTDVEYLHHFRALFFAFATLVFFFIGHKLAGFTGGVAAAAFWIGTPILNYWGKFFMTDVPSLAFIAAGYLFLLYSDRSRLSALLGGFLIGFGAFTRFTTIVLAFPAPFIILANFFHPFKRRNYQIIGELAKTLSGFVFATLPFLVLSTLLYRNPLQPFNAARYAVNQSPVDDPGYYIRNIWIEAGLPMKIGAILSILAVFILALSWGLKQVTVNEKKGKTPLINLVSFPKSFVSGLLYHGIILVSLILTTSIYLMGVTGIPHKLPRYIAGGVVPLIIIAAMGFGAFEKLILQFLRIPLKRITDSFNSFMLSVARELKRISPRKEFLKIRNAVVRFYLRLKREDVLSIVSSVIWWFHHENLIRVFKRTSLYFQKRFRFICNIWFIVGFLFLVILGISIHALRGVPQNVWDSTMNRKFDFKYSIPGEIVKNTAGHIVRRLQPEYNFATTTPAGIDWDMSINEKLRLVEEDPGKAYSTLKYIYGYYLDLYSELNKLMKPTEVLYVDRLLYIPFTPGYITYASIWLDDYVQYGYSLQTLIRRGYFPYTGYVVVFKYRGSEFFKDEETEEESGGEEESAGDEKKEEKAYDYFRSINRPAVQQHGSFEYVKSVSYFEIYRYKGGKPFPYLTEGEGEREEMTESIGETGGKKENETMMFLKEQYKKFFEFWLAIFEKEKKEEAAE